MMYVIWTDILSILRDQITSDIRKSYLKTSDLKTKTILNEVRSLANCKIPSRLKALTLCSSVISLS